MARGWESKAVESQIESAEVRQKHRGGEGMTHEQLRYDQERASLELTRTRVLRDLASATHVRHRQMLEAALQHIDDKIAAVKPPGS